MNYTKEEKAMWLEDWKRSGKGAWTYAKENGLIPQTFCAWAQHETKSAAGPEELAAAVKRPAPRAPGILIEYRDIKIHIPPETGPALLRAAIEGLRARYDIRSERRKNIHKSRLHRHAQKKEP